MADKKYNKSHDVGGKPFECSSMYNKIVGEQNKHQPSYMSKANVHGVQSENVKAVHQAGVGGKKHK